MGGDSHSSQLGIFLSRPAYAVSILVVKQSNSAEAQWLAEGLEAALELPAFHVEQGWRYDFDESEDPDELIEDMEISLNWLSDTGQSI